VHPSELGHGVVSVLVEQSLIQPIRALGPDDIWAVGTTDVTDTLVEHWDGKSWSVVPSPNVAGNGVHSFLTGVYASRPSNVWAVGASFSFSSPSTLIEHWDGSEWKIVSSPPAGGGELEAIAGLGGGPLVAAGFRVPADEERTLVLQR